MVAKMMHKRSNMYLDWDRFLSFWVSFFSVTQRLNLRGPQSSSLTPSSSVRRSARRPASFARHLRLQKGPRGRPVKRQTCCIMPWCFSTSKGCPWRTSWGCWGRDSTSRGWRRRRLGQKNDPCLHIHIKAFVVPLVQNHNQVERHVRSIIQIIMYTTKLGVCSFCGREKGASQAPYGLPHFILSPFIWPAQLSGHDLRYSGNSVHSSLCVKERNPGPPL